MQRARLSYPYMYIFDGPKYSIGIKKKNQLAIKCIIITTVSFVTTVRNTL